MLRFPASVGAHIVKERWIRRASTSGVFLFLRSASFALHISIVEILLSYLVFGLVELSISEPYEVGNLSSQQRWIFKCARDSLLVYFERGWEISSLYHYLSGLSKGSAWVVINFFQKVNSSSWINTSLSPLVSKTSRFHGVRAACSVLILW